MHINIVVFFSHVDDNDDDVERMFWWSWYANRGQRELLGQHDFFFMRICKKNNNYNEMMAKFIEMITSFFFSLSWHISPWMPTNNTILFYCFGRAQSIIKQSFCCCYLMLKSMAMIMIIDDGCIFSEKYDGCLISLCVCSYIFLYFEWNSCSSGLFISVYTSFYYDCFQLVSIVCVCVCVLILSPQNLYSFYEITLIKHISSRFFLSSDASYRESE